MSEDKKVEFKTLVYNGDPIHYPKYPIYVISKGRADTRMTARALDKIKAPYRIVIEPQEFDDYAKVINKEKILVLPFSNLGQGSIPARNWVWAHSIMEGAERHWILDDNIDSFMRLHDNSKMKMRVPTTFRCIEDFIDRYENVMMAGMNYDYLCPADNKIPPYYLNTRIYSCILLSNKIEHRWRGKYNEDTDLSIRILKDGWCTVLFNTFLTDKTPTLIMKGGNTDNVYIDGDNRMKFAKSLQEQHPDIVEITWKFNRWHHQVDYKGFRKNKLIRKKGVEIPDRVNNYGMFLEEK